VITPREYYDVLKSKLTLKSIDKIVKASIQKSTFKVICLGKGMAEIKNNKKKLKTEETYYAVVESLDLIDLRKSIQHAFGKNGGKKQLFDPENFDPHITLGFSKRDLFKIDGVVKNRKSCYAALNLI
jgi:hypothetical protein